MKSTDIVSSTKSAERRLGAAVAGTARPSRRRRAIFDQASQLGLKGLQRNAELLDRAAKDAAHPIKHKFLDQKKVTSAEVKLTKAANVAARRRAWADRDRAALALRVLANVLLNLMVFSALLFGLLWWIDVI
ncbi:MAG: hypothetical protein AAGJ34_08315 [Pseudomonadota bacterium]